MTIEDPAFEPIVESLLKYPPSSPEFEDAASVAGPAEFAEVLRQLDQTIELFTERQGDISKRLAQLEGTGETLPPSCVHIAAGNRGSVTRSSSAPRPASRRTGTTSDERSVLLATP